MLKFLRVTMLWLVLAPIGIFSLGAASNQMVLIANHDKFPVMLNEQKANLHDKDGVPLIDSYGMMDEVHCLMTKDTHLNALADIFDFREAIYSVGDGLIELGEWLSTFMSFVWAGLVIRRLYVG
jgi:hypothetical protein